MLYTPIHDTLWDCWIVPKDDKFYLYYLSITDDKSLFNSISLAISTDGVHFTEYGPVLVGDNDDQGWGTGMVQKIGDAYIMNYSITKDNEQIVHFAKSYDLINWEKLDNICRADGINYMRSADYCTDFRPRWDSLGVVNALDNDKPPFYGFITATTQNPTLKNRIGALGVLTSYDGLNWTCLPNAFENDITIPHFEVPEHFEINNRHYVIFCSSSFLGFNFYKNADYCVGGTFYVVSDNLLGKYRLPPHGDCMLQGTCDHISVSQVSVGRPLKLNGELLYYHIWGSNNGKGWFGTIKKITETAPYTLALEYCKINDALFGKQLDFKLSNIHCSPGKIKSVDFKQTGNSIFMNTYGTPNAISFEDLGGAMPDALTDLSDGRIITSTLNIKDGSCGFYFEQTDGNKIAVNFNKDKQRVEFGNIFNGWATCVPFKGFIKQACNISDNIDVMVFARKYFIEVYINGRYVSSTRTDSPIQPNKMGVCANSNDCAMSEIKIFKMK